MSFSRFQFYGCSIRGINASTGWNEQRSQVTVQLVVDPKNGDSCTATSGDLGKAAYLTFGGFTFGGLLQKFEKKNDRDGLPLYEAILEDPRDLLEVPVVLGGYNGSVIASKNIVNAYGYWENSGGFGAAQSNDTGMLWTKVASALAAIVNQPSYTDYGGPITGRDGHKYSLDLTELPSPPAYYRIGGNVRTILEIVSQICEDAGHDYHVILDGNAIKVKTVSRVSQPPLGIIQNIVDTNWGGNVVRGNVGYELRNEPTNAFLVGGNVTTLHVTSGVYTFWGYDIAGNPILGTNARFDFLDTRYTASLHTNHNASVTEFWFNNVNTTWPSGMPFYVKIDGEIIKCTGFIGTEAGIGTIYKYGVQRAQFGSSAASHANVAGVTYNWWSENTEYADLNASPVSSIIGGTSYLATEIEMRLALIDFHSWASYVCNYQPGYAAVLGLTQQSINRNTLVGPVLPPDLLPDSVANANSTALAINGQGEFQNQYVFYEFVKRHAQEYMGKKFAVSVPFVAQYQDVDTLRVYSSYNVSDGGYLPDGATPLGLSDWGNEVFKNPDGTFRSFCRFDNLVSSDLGKISSDSVLETSLFVGCQVDRNLIFAPSPAAVVTVAEGLFDKPTDPLGSNYMAAAVLRLHPNQSSNSQSASFGNQGRVRIHPAARKPTAVAVPLRSNTLTYGPWYAIGAVGKVKFEQDPTLVPWEYGGYTYLDLVANARVSEALTNMRISEAGTLDLVGPPAYSLGDVLEAGGPNISNVTVSYGTNGVTTSYAFHTFTPRFGTFSKANSERLKRQSQVSADLRKALKASIQGIEGKKRAAVEGAVAARNLLGGAPPAINPQTPHEAIFSQSFYDPSDQKVRVGVASVTAPELIGYANSINQERFQGTAGSNWTCLFRPFSTDGTKSLLMPAYGSASVTGLMNQTTLNPWKNEENDSEYLIWGTGYNGLHSRFHRPPPSSGFRPVGLRGPMVLAGWGFDTHGNAVPGTGDVKNAQGGAVSFPYIGPDGSVHISGFPTQDGGFASGYLNRQDWWAAGPVDHIFDRQRGVWTSHDVKVGVVSTGTYSGGRFGVTVDGSEIPAKPWFGATPTVGERTFCLFNASDLTWYTLGETSSFSATVPTGQRYTVFHTNASGSQEWSRTPTFQEAILGGSGIGVDGKLTLGNSASQFYSHLTSPASLSGDITYAFPANLPSSGQAVYAQSISGRTVNLAWTTLSSGTSSSLPTGSPYSVLNIVGSGSPVFNTKPEVHAIWLGGSGTSDTGFAAFGWQSSPNYLQMSLAGSPARSFDFLLPATLPSATGQVFSVVGFGPDWVEFGYGASSSGTSSSSYNYYFHSPEFQVTASGVNGSLVSAVWGSGTTTPIGTSGSAGTSQYFARFDHNHAHPVFSSGDLHPEYNLPNGLAYTVLHKLPSGNVWSSTPLIGGAYFGGSGTSVNGFAGLGYGSSQNYLKLGVESSPANDLNFYLPTALPTTGQVLTATAFGANYVRTAWQTPALSSGTTSGLFGLTTGVAYIYHTMCSSGSLVVGSGTLVYTSGLLTAVNQ